MRFLARIPHLTAVPLTRMTLAGLVCLLIGCTTARPIFQEVDARQAEIAGFENIRAPLDGEIDSAIRKRFQRAGSRVPRKYLAISGGGAGGAFSVGVLKAWSERGDRPTFDLVSGVSTGALIAPSLSWEQSMTSSSNISIQAASRRNCSTENSSSAVCSAKACILRSP